MSLFSKKGFCTWADSRLHNPAIQDVSSQIYNTMRAGIATHYLLNRSFASPADGRGLGSMAGSAALVAPARVRRMAALSFLHSGSENGSVMKLSSIISPYIE